MQKDWQLQGFVLCVFIISFLLLCGLETRYFVLYGKDGLLTLLLLLGIFAAVIVSIYYFKARSVSTGYRLMMDSKKVTVKFRAAHVAPTGYVRQRAQQLGITEAVELLLIPSTYNLVDAFAFSRRNKNYIVLTGGTQFLYLSGDEQRRNQFKFLIDHELGHIFHRDTNLLYLTAAKVQALLALIPLRIGYYFYQFYSSGQNMKAFQNFYSAVFPSVPKNFNGYDNFDSAYSGLMLQKQQMPVSMIFLFLILFSALASVLLYFLYREVIRRREFLADAFAVRHSEKDRAACVNIAESILYQPAIKNGPMQGYHGSLLWHPHPKHRLDNILHLEKQDLPSVVTAASILGLAFVFRFCYGATSSGEDLNTGNLYLLSIIFFLLLGGAIYTLFARSNSDDQGAYALALFKRLMQVSIWMTAAYSFIYFSFFTSGFQQHKTGVFGYDPMHGIDKLAGIEFSDKLVMIFSLPAVVFCFSYFYLPQLKIKLDEMQEKWMRPAAAYALGLVAIIVLGFISSMALRGYQTRLFAQYRQGEIERDAHPPQPLWKSLIDSAEFPQMYRIQDPPNLGQTGADLLEKDFKAHSFAPVFCFLALWQSPFKASITMEEDADITPFGAPEAAPGTAPADSNLIH